MLFQGLILMTSLFKKHYKALILLGLFSIYMIPVLRVFVNRSFFILKIASFDMMKSHISNFGVFSILVSFMFFTFDSLSFGTRQQVLLSINKELYGLELAFLLNFIFLVVLICAYFFLFRFFFRDKIQRFFCSLEYLKKNKTVNKLWSVSVFASLVLLIKNPYISFFVAISSMSFAEFLRYSLVLVISREIFQNIIVLKDFTKINAYIEYVFYVVFFVLAIKMLKTLKYIREKIKINLKKERMKL